MRETTQGKREMDKVIRGEKGRKKEERERDGGRGDRKRGKSTKFKQR